MRHSLSISINLSALTQRLGFCYNVGMSVTVLFNIKEGINRCLVEYDPKDHYSLKRGWRWLKEEGM